MVVGARSLAVALLLAPVAQPLQIRAPLRRTARVAPTAARVAPLSMQEGGEREREKSTGRTAVIARPKPEPIEKSREEVEKEGSWRVLLHNDDVHTFDYVNMAICKTVPTVTRAKAHRITVAAHTNNLAVVSQSVTMDVTVAQYTGTSVQALAEAGYGTALGIYTAVPCLS